MLSCFMDDIHEALDTVLKDKNWESELKKEIKIIEVTARSTFQLMLHLIDTMIEVGRIANLEIQKSQFHIQSVYKVKFENLTQALAVTSFDSIIPKYYSKTRNIVSTIRKSNVSHFDMIPSYAVWDEPQSGVRDRLKEELIVFEESHQEIIKQKLNQGSKAYNLAQQALNNPVSWNIQLIGYMEETYKDLIQQTTFTVGKAWQLVTQLARRIFLEVSRPRIGVNIMSR
jgi:hypothetical protein